MSLLITSGGVYDLAAVNGIPDRAAGQDSAGSRPDGVQYRLRSGVDDPTFVHKIAFVILSTPDVAAAIVKLQTVTAGTWIGHHRESAITNR